MGNRTLGLYNKFEVRRTDGKGGVGGAHYKCEYFVLDLDHDPFAMAALRGYVAACREEYPLLAADLEARIRALTPTGQKNPATEAG